MTYKFNDLRVLVFEDALCDQLKDQPQHDANARHGYDHREKDDKDFIARCLRRKNQRAAPHCAPQSKKRSQLEAAQDGGVVWRELLDTCDDQIYRIKARGMGSGTRTGLSRRSYLLATDDPFVVLPKSWVSSKAAFAPNIGDYAAVIYKRNIFPAVLSGCKSP